MAVDLRQPKLAVNGLPSTWLFPTTRYRGSKRKIAGWLWENLKDLEFSSALDVCGGTSIVSLLFKRMGKSVTYNDNLAFNHFTGIALVENKTVTLTAEDVDFLTTKRPKVNYSGFITSTFQSIYFKKKENEWLDLVVQNIDGLSSLYRGDELRFKRATAFWALGQACLMKRPFNLFHRKNLYIRNRVVERSFGNKTTWERPFIKLFDRFVSEASQVIFDNGQENFALSEDAFSLKQKGYDLVYFDPPYIFDNQRDNDYAKIYHFLEGLVDYENWGDQIDWESQTRAFTNGFREWPTTSNEKLLALYENLFKRFRNSKIVVSHKSGGLVRLSDIENGLSNLGKTVTKRMRKYNYALSKQNGKPRENIEWLIIGV